MTTERPDAPGAPDPAETRRRPAEPDGRDAAAPAGPATGADRTAPGPEAPRHRTELDLSAEELADRWRRTLADLDNLRKRYAAELVREREAERDRVAAAWLPVVDNLDLALAHAEADAGSAHDPMAVGVRAVRDQAVGVLAALGYPRHDEVGTPFDPAWHEVMEVTEAGDEPPGTVVRALRPGYGEPGRQLRPAAVAVTAERG
ncbi:nucleotide exchange factor GrpE [Marinitenerispora sediminis]|uniref:Protein GrpE n=1 Tax=Marinitenerispora sediminis TaxID=1931232 RepID=A0A368T5E0_9ACTN|nr:nucleotide exchange factor GrpE [Marinitenerispora sediminis]RCV54681.1 nucleotide exchange factor GrpE [Marinitenerispora sediminis]RCV54740.1 nucleotide exchange factor GrpE [Marinitenerispora sediminis]RCV58875.1 nucleotide exchange factor GrpE [Marinitenerispora sediminis]